MKITYYVASSLDGYIAKKNGDVSWLDELDISMEDSGYDDFFNSVDGLVMGRNTYKFVDDYGLWPYGDKPTWICTSNESLDVMDGCNIQTGFTPKDVIQEADKLKLNHLWLVGGGNLASSFIQSKELTHLSISQMPIILGGGIKIFGDFDKPVKVKMNSVHTHSSGFSQLEYEVKYA